MTAVITTPKHSTVTPVWKP